MTPVPYVGVPLTFTTRSHGLPVTSRTKTHQGDIMSTIRVRSVSPVANHRNNDED